MKFMWRLLGACSFDGEKTGGEGGAAHFFTSVCGLLVENKELRPLCLLQIRFVDDGRASQVTNLRSLHRLDLFFVQNGLRRVDENCTW
jgi:hypothetical protein